MPKSKKRRFHRFRRGAKRVKAAKPSLAIVAGLGVPPLMIATGASSQYASGSIFSPGISNKWAELRNRFLITYMGSYQNPSISGAINSVGVKAGVLGFALHWIANISGANRYLARMKAPVRI